jgi:protein-S-isoprenylcysteine O-methyltransferase Ste14
MTHDLLFRPILLAGFVTLVLIAGYRRIQSQSTGESLARTKIEEEKLVARFGDAYRSYMRRTDRFGPWFNR